MLTKETNRGVGQLLREVAEDGAHLARQEVQLARIEFAQIARDIGKGRVLPSRLRCLAF